MEIKHKGVTIQTPDNFTANSEYNRGRMFGGFYGSNNYTYSPQFTGMKRNMWVEFGYPETLQFKDYFAASRRNIGGVIVNKLPDLCWSTLPIVKDGSDSDTQFCKDVQHLVDNKQLWHAMHGLHAKSRVYQYGALVLALTENEAVDMSEPVTSVSGGIDSIVRIQSKYQDQVSSQGVPKNRYESNFASERYGLPNYFHYREMVLSDNNKSGGTQFEIHHDRVFTFSETAANGDLYGIPCLEMPFNAILGLEKVVGANPEAMFKNAQNAPYFIFKDHTAARELGTEKNKKAMKEAQQEFDAGMSPYRNVAGGDVKNLTFNVANPKESWTMLTQYIASTQGLPATYFLGHMVSEKASNEDNDKEFLKAKQVRENILTPVMIIPFFNKLIKLGVLTPPSSGKITIEWPELSEPSESDRTALVKMKMEANKLARDSGTDLPFPDVDEVRVSSGFSKTEELKDFSE